MYADTTRASSSPTIDQFCTDVNVHTFIEKRKKKSMPPIEDPVIDPCSESAEQRAHHPYPYVIACRRGTCYKNPHDSRLTYRDDNRAAVDSPVTYRSWIGA